MTESNVSQIRSWLGGLDEDDVWTTTRTKVEQSCGHKVGSRDSTSIVTAQAVRYQQSQFRDVALT